MKKCELEKRIVSDSFLMGWMAKYRMKVSEGIKVKIQNAEEDMRIEMSNKQTDQVDSHGHLGSTLT